ncbi:MAG: quinol monooxygenase YgiN [Candidatus Poriferisodalaceae bacterium]|jgi:quinol monooxygenase YgiN
MSSDERPFGVMVEFQIRPEAATTEEWLAEWGVRALDALHGEPETGTYASALNEDDDNQVLVFERYQHGDRSLEAHMARPAHDVLTDTMGERRMTKRRVMTSRFHELPDYGWWSRPGTDPSPAGAVVRFTGFHFDTDAQRDTFIERTREHAAYCWNNEPGTLVYSGGIAISDADREIDQQSGDLVFVAVYTDVAAADTHNDDPRHVALGEDLARDGVMSAPAFRRSYITTGHGYLWKAY